MDFQAPQELWNPLSKAVPGKFHGSGGHHKCNCFQDQTNFHRSRAWQIVLILTLVLNCPIVWRYELILSYCIFDIWISGCFSFGDHTLFCWKLISNKIRHHGKLWLPLVTKNLGCPTDHLGGPLGRRTIYTWPRETGRPFILHTDDSPVHGIGSNIAW